VAGRRGRARTRRTHSLLRVGSGVYGPWSRHEAQTWMEWTEFPALARSVPKVVPRCVYVVRCSVTRAARSVECEGLARMTKAK
jgi:hypothetical protein